MPDLCTKPTLRNRDHRLEFRSEEHGETSYMCMDCGETIVVYSDHQGL